MPKEFLYSRKFASQDKKVTTLSGEDLLTFSILEKGVYVTRLAAVKAIAVNTETNIQENKTLSKIAYGNGLVGKGTTDNPLNIDRDWMDQYYLNNKAWGFSQVGNPADSELPISGTYLSVSYPCFSGPSMRVLPLFPEANGDLSILKPVTNGEVITYVYATWKDYETTDIKSVIVTDTQYQPPGLMVDEWVGRCYSASSTHMVIEIFTRDDNGNTAFKEFGLVTFNGTLSAKQHVIKRLGTHILSDLIGWSTPTAAQWTQIRVSNLPVIEYKGEVYIGFSPRYATAIHGEGANTFNFVMGKLNSDSSITLLTGWTGGNEYGDVLTSDKSATIYSTIYSHERDSAYGAAATRGEGVTADNIRVTTYNSVNANHDFRIGFNFVDGDNIVLTTTAILESQFNNNLKNRRYITSVLKLNPLTKTVVTYPERKRSRLALTEDGSFNATSNETNWPGWYAAAVGSLSTILPNGMRLGTRSSYESTFPPMLTEQRPITKGLGFSESLKNSNFTNTIDVVDLDAKPPTVVPANKLSQILHGRLMIYDAGFRDSVRVSNSTGKDAYVAISGTASKTYNVLNSDNETSTIPVKGYVLNNDRGLLGNRVEGSLVSVSVGSMIYYHNATWGSNATNTTKYFAITKDYTSTSTYKMSTEVASKIEAFVSSIPITTYNDEYHTPMWYFTPVYPGIGKDYAFLEVIRIERKLDAQYGDYIHYRAMVKITNTKDSAGNYTITDVDLTNVNYHQHHQLSNKIKLNQTENAACLFFRAFKFYESGKIVIGHRGGPTYTEGVSSTWYDRTIWFASFNSDLTHIANKQGISYILPSIEHNTKEIGYVTPLAGGGFYGFYPMSEDLVLGEPTILTSPRPPAGFTITVATPIPVNVLGRQYYIDPFVWDLTTILPDLKNKTLYLSAEIQRGVAYITVQYDRYAEHEQRIHIGTITTTESEISEIKTKPVTLWECARPSVDPIGAAIAVSTGHPSDTDGVTIWENITLLNQSYSEYFWGPRDIIDVD